MSNHRNRLPQPFLDKLHKVIPLGQWDKTLKTFAQEKPTTFRVNSLKSSGGRIKEHLESQGLKIENVLWYKDAFILRKGSQRDLEKTDVYSKGEIYVQGLSGMVPPLALQPQPGEKILDLTAAPGSKTTQLAALMKGMGTVIANDDNPVRAEKLKSNLMNQGASNTAVLPPGDGGLVWKNHFEAFDRVLLDAPCSSEGRFQSGVPSTYGYWREDTNRKMAKDQRRLFKSAFLCLKTGGTMVYSTCTFAPEENEGILQWALETYQNALALEEIPLPLPVYSRGLEGWEGLKFHPSVVKSVRILPSPVLEGFFVARLRKTRSVAPSQRGERLSQKTQASISASP